MSQQQLGPYVLERLLARGGMGHVWQARLTGIKGFTRAVAVKEVNPSLAVDGNNTDLFLREARAGARLLHPNVASVLDVGIDGDRLYLAMELVDGLDLRRIMKRSQLLGVTIPAPLTGLIVHQVLCALEAAHALTSDDGGETPLVHRDISPENILVGRYGDVRVADFGLARTNEAHDQLTQVGVVKGKINYMAPEQLQAGPVDPAWDLYALGNVLHELLTGTKPYDANNPLQALDLARSSITTPADLHPEIPRALSDLATTLRNQHPEQRPTATRARGMAESALATLIHGVPSAQLADFLGYLTRNTTQKNLALPAGGPCAKCGGTLQGQWTAGNLVIDRCNDCRGVWLDAHEVSRVVGNALIRTGAERTVDAPPLPTLDAVVGDCPRGHGRMTTRPITGRDFSLEICPLCKGVWLDAGELEAVTQGDIVQALLTATNT